MRILMLLGAAMVAIATAATITAPATAQVNLGVEIGPRGPQPYIAPSQPRYYDDRPRYVDPRPRPRTVCSTERAWNGYEWVYARRCRPVRDRY